MAWSEWKKFGGIENLGTYTGTQTIDCTTLSNYDSLTVDNFIVEITNITLKTHSGNSNINYPEFAIEKSYDSSSGTLTITGAYGVGDRRGEIQSITYNVWFA